MEQEQQRQQDEQECLRLLDKIISEGSNADDRTFMKKLNSTLRGARTKRASREAADLYVGMRVEFDKKSGGTIQGTIERINQKTVTLKDCSDNGPGWRVSPGTVRPVVA